MKNWKSLLFLLVFTTIFGIAVTALATCGHAT